MNSQYLKIGLLFFCLMMASCNSKALSRDVLDIKLVHTVPSEFDKFYIGFNPKSDMYHYKGEVDGEFFLVINGEVFSETKAKDYWKVGNVTLAKNAYGFFYGEPESQYLRINKDTFGPYSGVVEVGLPFQAAIGSISVFESHGKVIFDKSGKHFCFIAKEQDRWVLVKDGKKEDLSNFTKSIKPIESKRPRQDGKIQIYFVEHALDVEKIFPEGLNDAYGEAIGLIFKEGKVGKPTKVETLYPLVDPKSNIVRAGGSSLHVNGYGPPQFSSGCPKFFEVIYNDQRVANYEHQEQTNPVLQLMLSKDGKHYAYMLKKVTGLINTKKSYEVVVDGHSGPEYDYIGSMRFEENAFHYMASKGRDIYALKHRLD